jgi:hypothetical protein
LELIVSVALAGPAAVGLKLKDVVQVALTATRVQLPVRTKAVAFGPDSTKLLMVIGAEPVFRMAKACVALVVPTNWSLKARAEGVRVMIGAAATPVPDNGTVVGELGAFEVMTTEADFTPSVVGLNDIAIVQLPLGATVAQPFVGVKDVASIPVTVTPVTDKLALPVLVIVTVDAALAVLIGWLTKVTLTGDKETPGESVRLF